jgi:hypothetical protein
MYRKPMVVLALIGTCVMAGSVGAAPLVVKINFQTAGAQVPQGYLADSGQAFGNRGNGFEYGWSRDISADSRERTSHADKRYGTLLHLQKGAAAVWEIVVPNGKYDLHIVCGDADYTDQTNSLDVEGVIVADPNGQTGNFDKYDLQVTVADGRLTIQPALVAVPAAANSKICFVDIVAAVPPNKAMDPVPADQATDIPRDVVLGWTAGETAATHDVYLGADFTDVNNAVLAQAVSPGQTATAYEPTNPLAYGQTYYWRVDEVNAPPSTAVFKGDTWSFTVEPYAYPVKNVTATASSAQPGMGPQNTVNGSGLDADDQHSIEGTHMWLSSGVQPNWIQFEFEQALKLHEMWVWNSNQLIEAFIGFGAKSIKIEYSADGETWTELAGVPEFAKAAAAATYTANTTVDFGGVTAQYVKLTISSTWGGLPTAGLSEVRFFSVPVQAREPVPAVGTADVDVDVDLNWRPGREAISHQVFFGADEAAVADGTAAAQTVTGHSFTPAAMNFGTQYFWKVDEIGGDGPYAGNIWSFTTREYAAIDNFEAYNDDDNRIYDSWIDGVTTGASGSQVGYMEAPFAEKTIRYAGGQSMPLIYDNANSPFVSEAELAFNTAQNWTTNGADSLVVNFRGQAPGFAQLANGNVVMSAIGADIWNNADEFRYAYKTLNGDGTMVARVESLGRSNDWAKAGVMIRQSIEPSTVHAFMPITPIGGNGASFQHRLTLAGVSTNNDNTGTAVAAPYWVKIERKGNAFTGFISPDGTAWTQLGTAQTITMTGPVLIGLALTSHSTTATTAAEFSNISTTGNVTGNWQVAEIGVAQPVGNSIEGLYLSVKDSSGKTLVVQHPDAAATANTSWQQWTIPLSEFTAAGVKMNAVKSLVIGVGNKAAPVKGGAGTVFIDEIGYGRSAAE